MGTYIVVSCRAWRSDLTRHAPRASGSDLKTQNKKNTPLDVFFFWQGQKDLNPRHAVLETAALPTELYPYVFRRL